METRDSHGCVLCPHGRPIQCIECGEEYAAEINRPPRPTPARAEASEGDPWQDVTPYNSLGAPTKNWYEADQVDRARAAVEAAHRQEIARLKKQRRQLVHEKRDLRNAIDLNVQTIRLMQTQRDEAMAERDALTAQVAALREAATPIARMANAYDPPEKVRALRAAIAATEGGIRAYLGGAEPTPPEAPPEPERCVWQPIETAPKDRWILLWGAGWREGGKPDTVPVLALWSSFSHCFVTHEAEVRKPTHWCDYVPVPLTVENAHA